MVHCEPVRVTFGVTAGVAGKTPCSGIAVVVGETSKVGVETEGALGFTTSFIAWKFCRPGGSVGGTRLPFANPV